MAQSRGNHPGCETKVGDMCVYPELVEEASAANWAGAVGTVPSSGYPSETQAPQECSAIKPGLMPHQESIVRWSASVMSDWRQTGFLKHRGLLTFHNVGAGKTREMVGIMVAARKLMPDAMVVFVATKKQIEQLFGGDLANDYRAMPPAMLADANLPDELREEDVVLTGKTKRMHLPRYDHGRRSVVHRLGRSQNCAYLDPLRFGGVGPGRKTPAVVGVPIEEFSRHILRKDEIETGAKVKRSWTDPFDFGSTDVVYLFDEAHNLQKPPPSINTKDKNRDLRELYLLMQSYFRRTSVEARSFLVLLTSTPANSFEDFMGISKLLLYKADHGKIDRLMAMYKENDENLSQQILDEWSMIVKGKIHAFQALNLFTYPRLQFMMKDRAYKDGSESPLDTAEGIRQLAQTGPQFDDTSLLRELLKMPRVASDPARTKYLGTFNPLHDFSNSLRNKNNSIPASKAFQTSLRGKQFLGSKGTFGKQLRAGACFNRKLALFSPKLDALCKDLQSTRGEKHLIACNRVKRYDLGVAVATVLEHCLKMERFDMRAIAPRPKSAGDVRRKVQEFLDKRAGEKKKRYFYLHSYPSSTETKVKTWYWEAIRSASSKSPGVFNLPANRDGSMLEAIVLTEMPDYEGVSLKYLKNIHVMDVFPMDSFGQIIGRGQRPCSFGPETPKGRIKIKIYATSWPEAEQVQMFSGFTRRIAARIHLTDGSKPWVKTLKRKLSRIAHRGDKSKAYEAKSALRLLDTFLQKDGGESHMQSAYDRAQALQAEQGAKLSRSDRFKMFWEQVQRTADAPDAVTKAEAREFFDEASGHKAEALGYLGPADFGSLLAGYYDYKKVLQMYIQTMAAAINCREFQKVHDVYGAMPAGASVKGLRCYGSPSTQSSNATGAVLIDIDQSMRTSPFSSMMGLFANRLRSIAKRLRPTDLLEKQEIMDALREEYGDEAAPAAFTTFVEIVEDII